MRHSYASRSRGSIGALSHFFVGTKGSLAYDGCVSDDGSGGLCLDVPGSGGQFAGPDSVAVSPNGASVYTSTRGSSGGTTGGGGLAHLFADPTHGQLSWDGCVTNGGSGGTGRPDSAVSHLFANPAQGQLSWDGCVSNDSALDRRCRARTRLRSARMAAHCTWCPRRRARSRSSTSPRRAS